MRGKVRRFADDGWAVWIEGDDTSAFYLDEWINPGGKSYVDVAVNVRDIDGVHGLFVYVPFSVEASEIEDISYHLGNPDVFQAVFSSTGLVDMSEDGCLSTIAYHGRVVDLLHISKLNLDVRPLSEGTLISLSFDEITPYLEGDEIYLFFRIPHKSIDKVYAPAPSASGLLGRLRELIVSPVSIERYGCSVRINEARLLPPEIGRKGALLRQKLDRSVVTMHLSEDYSVDASSCDRIHRLEEGLYESHAPKGFDLKDAVVYQWQKNKGEDNLYGHFNYYFDIRREKLSSGSVAVYLGIIFLLDFVGNLAFRCIDPFLG